MRHAIGKATVVLVGSVLTCALVFAAVEDAPTALVLVGLLLGGPAWAYGIAAVSDDSDFAGAGTSRAQWLDVLPWTFLAAPLVLPNMFILAGFVRDSRADNGHSALTSDRMRPGDASHDHHWPD